MATASPEPATPLRETLASGPIGDRSAPQPTGTGKAPSAPELKREPIERALLTMAKQDDREAIEKMFRQFLPLGEEIKAAEYLGVFGFWGFGRDSFAVATDRRVAGIQVGGFGEILYQDAPLEYVNSTVLHQPSLFGLYVRVVIVALFTSGIGLLLAPLIARSYYRRHKSGLVLWVRSGVSVYIFIDRKRILTANKLYREIASLRDERVRLIGHP